MIDLIRDKNSFASLFGLMDGNNGFVSLFGLMRDSKGFASLIDSLLSIFILLMVLIAFNMVMDIEIPSLSEENNGFKTGQDLMEIMSSKIDGRDYSVIEKVSYILSRNNNSIESKREVKKLLDDFFASHSRGKSQGFHYAFSESNQLNGEVLSSDGDFKSADQVNVAVRNYGNYSYKLYLF